MIDVKDLQPFKASELQVGGTFYVKEGEEFLMAKVDTFDLRSPRTHAIRALTHQLSVEGKLFVRINRPWMPFDI